jgi:16S rRNA G527 N7-methylase RsmG
MQVTSLEANHKKSLFLKEAKDDLRLDNLKVVTSRLEEISWARYELLTSRALDRAEVVLPLIIEELSPGQRLMLYCGPDLIAKLKGALKYKIEIHRIPQSEARLIAILSACEVPTTAQLPISTSLQ